MIKTGCASSWTQRFSSPGIACRKRVRCFRGHFCVGGSVDVATTTTGVWLWSIAFIISCYRAQSQPIAEVQVGYFWKLALFIPTIALLTIKPSISRLRYRRKATWFRIVKCYVHPLIRILRHTQVQWAHIRIAHRHRSPLLFLEITHLLGVLQTEGLSLPQQTLSSQGRTHQLGFRWKELVELVVGGWGKHLESVGFGMFGCGV